jgi:C4-dicarboxylate-specific signal transduction histidine kinase
MSIDRLSRRAWRPIDVNIVVIESSRLMQRIVGDDVRVTVALGVNSDYIMAERLELERILLALAMNARHAMPNGGVLTVQTASLRQMPPRKAASVRAESYVRLTFTDSGAGLLSAGRIAAVRDKPLRGLHGADLAMAVIAHTVRTLDGTLQIVGQKEAGSRVIIDLPCIDPMGRPELIETV